MNPLKKIQSWMFTQSIDLFIINRTDEFLNEYIASYAERLKWISNFSGSSGRAIITQKKGILFVDGRYTFQAHEEVDDHFFNIMHMKNYWDYLEKICNDTITLSLDPSLHSIFEIQKLENITESKKTKIIYLNKNPIDTCWDNQPLPPHSRAFIHEEKYAGENCKSKIEHIQNSLSSTFIDFYVLTSLDSIAWLLNIRGNDIEYTPLIMCYAVIPQKGKVHLFLEGEKITLIKENLDEFVNFYPKHDIEFFIKNLNTKIVVGMDENQTPYYFKKICNEASITTIYLNNPCSYPKAKKNEIELKGARNANIRDGISVTKYLYWLKNEMQIENTDEIKAANYLLELRKNNRLFYSLSFDTISAFGPHAALPHYRVTHKSNLPFKNNFIYLVDSGAQYRDGTTDITRTIIIGKPTLEQKDRFTRVLKGHIAIATKEFNKNMIGSELDPLARRSLQEIGCDYDHGTGHGIGSFLCVHEGPQRISKSQGLSNGTIYPGMIISNEPGYYKKNEYGIRIENLVITYLKSNNKMGFETISWAPIDIELIDVALLLENEKKWINNYHKLVYEKINTFLTPREKVWLLDVTKPL